MVGPCEDQYVASTFATTAINGVYTWGGRHNLKAAYTNGAYWLFYSSGLNVWAIAPTLGATPAQWVSNSVVESGDCPAGVYTDASGLIS
jgi:hypothetical protein